MKADSFFGENNIDRTNFEKIALKSIITNNLLSALILEPKMNRMKEDTIDTLGVLCLVKNSKKIETNVKELLHYTRYMSALKELWDWHIKGKLIVEFDSDFNFEILTDELTTNKMKKHMDKIYKNWNKGEPK